MELKYSGGFDGTHVYGRAGLSSSIWESWMELKYVVGLEGAKLRYTGGFDGAQVYMRV